MAREVGKIQPQNSSRRIISNQSSSASNSSVDSGNSDKMRKPLLDERWTSILYTLVVALLYVTAGTMVGWSSGTFRRSNGPGAEPLALPLLDNWSISLAATPAIIITVTACVVHRCYHWIGTKAFLLTASLLAIGSSTLEAYGLTFWSASAARILAGIAAGIAFTLVPSYVDEFGSATGSSGPHRPPLNEILATAFPLGVLLRFAADLLPLPADPTVSALVWGALPTFAFVGLLFLPDSARFLCANGRVAQAAAILQRTHEPAAQPALQECLARWQQPGPGLVEALRRQANFTLLVPLLALFALQAFLGVLPMLFYLAGLVELAGEQVQSPERVATLLVALFTLAVPVSRYLHASQLQQRPVLVLSALLIALATLALGWHCHERRTRNLDLTELSSDWPFYCFALMFVAYAVGFYRLPGTLLAAEVADENLLALRTVATAVGWGSVYLGVRLLPVLLRTIGLGWVLWNVALVALSAAGLVLLCLPAQDEYAHKALAGGAGPSSMTSSVCSTGSGASPVASACWPCGSTTDQSTDAPQHYSYAGTRTPGEVIRGPELV
ncbi:facilitated trehalose transporter Tret1-like [Anopheles arabiensis]|uniref:Major facilitator superfamily (MFS) profile domain-containing protein n=1 Tax=Anopheles arabiensis TaxID=7173 RepID=A0A182HIS1_ANOAR|nr:facilitated trehalose transporter Tret1-like [Anopheles arabiensis]